MALPITHRVTGLRGQAIEHSDTFLGQPGPWVFVQFDDGLRAWCLREEIIPDPAPTDRFRFPEVTVTGTEDDVMDFLEEYCGEDHDQALYLFETAVPLPDAGRPGICSVTVDWVPRADR